LSNHIEYVCPECFGDESLKSRVRELQSEVHAEKDETPMCDFHEDERGVSIEKLVEVIDPVFRQHYAQVQDTYYGESGGDDLEFCVSELAQIEEPDVASTLASALIEADPAWPPDGDEPFYVDIETYIRRKGFNSDHSWKWEQFRKIILHEERFFSSWAKGLLDDLFEGVHLQEGQGGVSPVRVIEPRERGSAFYRARVANTAALQRKISSNLPSELGPPPERLRRAGRLNSAGIPTFYGAFDLDTCVAELRPRVGDCVVGTRFSITKPLTAIDLTLFQGPSRERGQFDKGQVQLTEQWQFMTSFMREISRPVSPDDEHLDYVPTQVVAEYLLHHYRGMKGSGKKIEAIVYWSAQFPAGKNIAIMGDACKTGLLSTGPNIFNILFRLTPDPSTFKVLKVEGAKFTTKEINEDSGNWGPEEEPDF